MGNFAPIQSGKPHVLDALARRLNATPRAASGAGFAAEAAAGRLSLSSALEVHQDLVIDWKTAYGLLWPQDAGKPKRDRIYRLVNEGRELPGVAGRVRLPVYPTLSGMAFRLGDVLHLIELVTASYRVTHGEDRLSPAVNEATALRARASRLLPAIANVNGPDGGGQLPARRERRRRPSNAEALRLVGGYGARKEANGGGGGGVGQRVDVLA